MSEASLSQEAIYSARPTLRFAGREDARASRLVVAMRVDESEGGMSRLELRLSNWASTTDGGAGLAFPARSRLAPGERIEVYAGDEAAPREIFRGRISAVEADFRTGVPPEITVLAEDALQSARMARRSRVYARQSPKAVAETVARGLGLVPVVAGLAAPVDTWAQIDESDLSFLRRLLGRLDADLQVVGDELHVSPRADVDRGTLELQLHGQLGRARVSVDLADQATAVSVRGWDAARGAAVEGRASAGASLGPGAGSDGPSVLARTLGEREERLAGVTVASDDEARAVAQAAFDRRARRFVRVDATTEGNARLRVGTRVRLTGLDERFDNTYYVVRASHLYDLKRGFRTEFGGECAFLGGPAA